MNEMNRFELNSIPLSDYEELTDNVTGKTYLLHGISSKDICELVNDLSDRGDKIIESFLTEELLNLRWKADMHERYNKEVLKILSKYGIDSLEKLDRVLFEQRVW